MNALGRTLVVVLNKSLIIKKRTSSQLIIFNCFHSNYFLHNQNNSTDNIVPYRFNVERKEKDVFLEIIRMYEKEDLKRKGQLDFIKYALKYMDEFGVNKDIVAYKALFNIFPKGKYIPQNQYQRMMYHYPKHQDTAFNILNKMQENRVIPDDEMYQLIKNIFGRNSLIMKKYYAMLYWLPKFAFLNPWPIPEPPPTDPKELAHFAIEKMCKIDVQSDVTVYNTKNVLNAIDHTWIVSAMSKSQEELLVAQPIDKSLSVEGPFTVWVDKYCIDYFVLKGDPIKRKVIYGEYDDVCNLKMQFWERHHFKLPVTIHEQDDGVYYAMCATGTSSKDSLLSWIRCLQEKNQVLEKIPITFKIQSAVPDTLRLAECENATKIKTILKD